MNRGAEFNVWKASRSCGVKPDDEKQCHRQTGKYTVMSKPVGRAAREKTEHNQGAELDFGCIGYWAVQSGKNEWFVGAGLAPDAVILE